MNTTGEMTQQEAEQDLPPTPENAKYNSEEMIEELRRVAGIVDGPLSRPKFKSHDTRISANAIEVRFGGWLTAVKSAGLEPAYSYGGIWKPCPLCGTEFRTDNSSKSRKYCSDECTREAQRLHKPNRKGEESSPQAARGRARSKVDLDECVECGDDGSGSQLEVHHRDGDPYNNDLSNLQVLCSTCHGEKHRKSR